MRDYRKLETWNIARGINKKVYLITRDFPKEEVFGLFSQMRRASISIMSNISEGCRCDSNKEFISFLRIAIGSAKELESQFYASLDVNYIKEKEFDEIMEELDKLGKKLWAYIKYLRGDTNEEEGP